MKKILALLLAVLMLLSVFTACAKKDAAETTESTETSTTTTDGAEEDFSNETYYYIAPLAHLEYWLAHKAGLEDACAELGVTPKFVGDESGDVDAMCSIIETALNDPNCSGIVLQANYADAYEPYVIQAKEMGIPVCYQTLEGVEGSQRLCYLGTDYYEYGRTMMQQAAKATGGKGGVIISNNLSAGVATVENLMNGIRDEVKNYPDMEIVAEVDDTSDAAVAATKVGAALLANPDTTVVIGGQSTSAIGAVTAIKEAGLSDSVQVISIDRDAATLEYIQSGDIYATVAGKQYTEVYYGVKICYDYNHGSKNAYSLDDEASGQVIAPSFVDTGSLVIDQSNVDNFVGFSYADR